MNGFLSLPATERFSIVLDGLYRAVAARFAGRRLPVALITLICARLRRFEREVLALVAAIRAGRVRVGHGHGGRPGVARGAKAKVPNAARLPRGFAWLIVAVPYEAANYASQLRAVLQDPEMATLIAGSPRLAKLLRPMCRALALEASVTTPVAETPEAETMDDFCDQREQPPAPLGFSGSAVAPDAPTGMPPEADRDCGFSKPA